MSTMGKNMLKFCIDNMSKIMMMMVIMVMDQ